VKSDWLLSAPRWVADWVPNIDDEHSIEWVRRVAWTVLLAGVLALVVSGADRPPDPFLPSERTTQVSSPDGP